MNARLHIVMGAGGVGKTTIATSYALALAARGHRTGLLGIDPSQRLQDALGLALNDLDAPVGGQPHLRAAIMQPHQAVRRWVTQSAAAPDVAARLEANPFFRALGDHLATATDVLSAARIAEWAEGDPCLEDLVVDTAPGLSGVDFLRSPKQVEALITGPLVRWLRVASRAGAGTARGLSWGARRVLDTFSGIAGARMLADFAEFFSLVRGPLEGLLVRIGRTERWIRSDSAELLLVTAPGDAEAAGARQVATALRAENLGARACLVNRTWPEGMAGALEGTDIPTGAEGLVRYARACCASQQRVIAASSGLAPRVITLGSRPAVGSQPAALAAMGERLLIELELPPQHRNEP